MLHLQTQILWPLLKEFPSLMPGEAQVFCANLNVGEEKLKQLWSFLSEDEKHRAERFKFDIHRQRFIASKGILREILGNYLKIAPEKIKFFINSHGKPYLGDEINKDIFFNSSDSQNIALYAVTKNQEIGIDIEYIRDADFAAKEIAQRFFSPAEIQILDKISEKEKKLAFFNCWTRKEAFIKCIGQGLSYPLNQFDVSVIPGEPAKLLTIKGNSEEAKNWELYELQPALNFAAAMAVKGKFNKIHCWQFYLA